MWATITQLDGLPGLPASRPHRRAMLERLNVSKRERAARGGGFEYLVTSLPSETQVALAAAAAGAVRPVIDAMAVDQVARQQADADAHSASMVRYGTTLEAAGGFDPERNPKLDLFQRFETYHRARGGSVWAAIGEFCALWDAGNVEAHAGTRQAHPTMSPKTLDKWYRAWRTLGVEALLARKPRKDKGVSQLSEDEQLHQVFVAALAEMHDPTARQVHRVIVHQLGADRAPAEGTLKRWLREYKASNRVALMKIKNYDGWRNKYMPAFGSRSEHITAVNEEWQLDSTIADAQQRVEVAFNLTDGETGELRRHALVAGIDVFTKRATVVVSRTSSANAVKAVMRKGMLAFGRPTRVKTDNGKDYVAQDFDFALKSLGIDHILCTPFSPDQKPFIERFFGTLLRDLFPMLQGFVGHSVADRKAIESSKGFAARFGEKGCDLRMTPEQLQRAIDSWLDEYHARPHSELGCSPNEMAARHQTHVVRVDDQALAIFMMLVAGNGTRVVGKRGISMDNGFYTAPELARADVMGQTVYCRVSDDDMGALYVFNLGGEFLCRALDHTRLGINRGELAAKTRQIEARTLGPAVAALRKAARQGLTQKAVHELYQERTDQAVQQSPNVARLTPRVITETTPAIASVTNRPADPQAEARAAARAALEEQQPAPVVIADNPRHRYSAWVRLQARVQRGEQLSAADARWLGSYEDTKEFAAWHSTHDGEDPLAQAAG